MQFFGRVVGKDHKVSTEDILRATMQAILTASRPDGQEARTGEIRIPHVSWARAGAEWDGANGDFLFKMEGEDIVVKWQEAV